MPACDANFRERETPRWALACLAGFIVALAAALFALDGNIGINFADEGYLWTGTLALKAGQIPIRDFQAYDPGRYVWLALCSFVFGDSLVGLRAACALFACGGVLLGTLAARRVSRSWPFTLLVATALTLWMIPRFKSFEQSIALAAVYVLVRLLENPSRRAQFFAGVFVGAMAWMGRNHGLYLAFAFALAITIRSRGEWREGFAQLRNWLAGILVGFTPHLLLMLCARGHLAAYLEMLRVDLAVGTNLSMHVMWPWLVFEMPGTAAWWNAFVQGWLFVALPVAIVLSAARVLRLSREELAARPLLLASACVLVPYAHYVFSRADATHLAHAAPVLLLVIIAFGSKLRRPVLAAAALSVVSFVATFQQTDFATWRRAPRGKFVSRDVAGRAMLIPRQSAAILDAALEIAARAPGEPLFFAPHLAGLYAATQRRSPVPQTYFIWPASAEAEAKLIDALEVQRVSWVMLQDDALDGRDEFRFRRTHPRTTSYFAEKFEPVALRGVPADVTVLRRKSAAAADDRASGVSSEPAASPR